MKQKRRQQAWKVMTTSALAASMFFTPVLSNIASAHTTAIGQTKEAKQGHQLRNVMYYGDWSIWGGQGNFYPKDIPADQLTHLNYAFVDFDAEGNLHFTDTDAAIGNPVGMDGVSWGAVNAGVLNALQDLRAKHPNLKIGVSLGGWSKSGDFSDVAASKEKRAKFVANVMKFIEYTNMDFVDVDWEFPGEVRLPDKVDNKNDEGTPHARPEDKQNYISLLQDLRAGLDQQGKKLGKTYELSVALPAPKSKTDVGIDVAKLFQTVDFANIMTYDMRGAWDDTSGHQTGLYTNPKDPVKGNNLSIDESVKYLESKGAPADKIVIGAAYYTRGWEKVTTSPNSETPGLFGHAEIAGKDADLTTDSRGALNEATLSVGDGGRRGGVWSYRSLDKLKQQYPGLKEYWDDAAKAPYLYDANTGAFFTYDNTRSIKEKADYVLDHNLGGVIGWMASQDKQTTGTSRDELTKATKQGLFGNSALPEQDIVYADLDVQASIDTYEEWGQKGIEITIKNNEILNEQGDVLAPLELSAETIKMPKFYIKGTTTFTQGDYHAGTVTEEGEYTVVDLSSVFEAKLLKPNTTYKFRLKGDGKVESIALAQSITQGGKELGRQVIYGNESNLPEVNTAPVFAGVVDRTIKVGDNFDVMAGVTATDKEDGNLTANIQVTGTVNTNEKGAYELTYKVADSKGLQATAKRIITVEEKATTPNPTPNPSDAADEMVNPKGDVMVGYWHNWDSKSDGYKGGTALAMDLTDIHEGYNVVDVSFMKADGHSNIPTFKPYNKTDKQFREEIGELNAEGRAVILALGGADAHIELTKADKDAFVKEIIRQVDTYGFDGLDIDLEQTAITAAENRTVLPEVLKEVKDHYAKEGKNFLITMAPEVPYLTSNGAYAPYINGLEGYYDWINPQYYNQGAWGIWVDEAVDAQHPWGMQTTLADEGVNGTTAQQKENGLYYISKGLINGKYGLIKIPANKLVMGLPSNPDGAGTGYVKTASIVANVFNRLKQDGTPIKGLMTWSVNWDNGVNNQGKAYNWEFVNRYKDLLDLNNGSTNPTPPTTPENSKPVLSGMTDVTLTVGDQFDKLAGVTATDKEDGNLTASIKVSGTVDTNKAGVYTLTYSVTDSKGAKTTGTRTITVKEKAPEVNTAPELKGISDKTIKVGDKFDALAGVTATDKEDGNLTASIKVSGTVNTSKAGVYKLTYSVTDSKGVTTTKTRTITVEEDTAIAGDTFDPSKIYVGGDKVVYKGEEYVAQWWTQGGTPDTNSAWKLIVKPNADGTVNYRPGQTYVGGDKVRYDGKIYKANWWAQSVPGSDASWTLIG